MTNEEKLIELKTNPMVGDNWETPSGAVRYILQVKPKLIISNNSAVHDMRWYIELHGAVLKKIVLVCGNNIVKRNMLRDLQNLRYEISTLEELIIKSNKNV